VLTNKHLHPLSHFSCFNTSYKTLKRFPLPFSTTLESMSARYTEKKKGKENNKCKDCKWIRAAQYIAICIWDIWM